jgi:N6-adenosine-specific RNA methylase IME4
LLAPSAALVPAEEKAGDPAGGGPLLVLITRGVDREGGRDAGMADEHCRVIPPARPLCYGASKIRKEHPVAAAHERDLSAHPGRQRQARRLRADQRAGPLPPLPEVPGGWVTVLADPPWRFANRTGKVAPEHRRLDRYDTMTASQIASLPVAGVVAARAHLYLWVPNALLPEGLTVMAAWGFRYVSNLVWAKRRKDGGPDGRGVGFYFRNVTELVLFGVRGRMRTLPPARRQVNLIEARKREHSRKPDEAYAVIESCSPGPYLELFARYPRPGWAAWGDEAGPGIIPRGRRWPAYGA